MIFFTEKLEHWNYHFCGDLFSTSGFDANPVSKVAKSVASGIQSHTLAKTDFGSLTYIFPEFTDVLTGLEFHCIEDDGSLTEALSTPDVKLYYPEPFIASPSFVHEDLWFIHVLHYQH